MKALSIGLSLKNPNLSGESIFVWDFTNQTPGPATLPDGLTFARASSGHTVPTGEATIVSGGGIDSNNVGRIGRMQTSHSYGLFIEPSRTNSCRYSRSMNLAPGASSGSITYTTGRTGPDGTTNAIRGQISSGGYANYDTVPSPGTFASNTRMVLSVWVKKGAGSGAYQCNADYTGTTGAAVGGTAGADWGRVASASFVYPAGTACYPVGWDGRVNSTIASSAGARDCEIDFVQIEAGGYASSAIITTGSTATRAAERLTIDSTRATQAAQFGRLSFYLRFRALCALSELGSTDGQLIWGIGDTNTVWLAPSGYVYADDGYGGARYSLSATGAVSWARQDLVEIRVEVGAGKTAFRYRINNGSVVSVVFSDRDDTFNPLTGSGGVDVMCSETSWVTPCVLEKVGLFVPRRNLF